MSAVDPLATVVWCVDPGGQATVLSMREWEAMIGVSADLSAAVDILNDHGMLNDKRLKLLQAAESGGKDPVVFARHLVKLVEAFNR
jgi:hypothetical protein